MNMRSKTNERETREVADAVFRVISYDSNTGDIFRKLKDGTSIRIENSKRTDRWGCSYYLVSVCNKKFMVHRIAWLLHYGEWPDGQVDHVDGDGLNNKISNLRCVSNQLNAMNQKMRSDNSSGFVGVRKHGLVDRWQARVVQNGSEIYLGLFKTKEEAIEARRIASIKYGFHENHGRCSKVVASNSRD